MPNFNIYLIKQYVQLSRVIKKKEKKSPRKRSSYLFLFKVLDVWVIHILLYRLYYFNTNSNLKIKTNQKIFCPHSQAILSTTTTLLSGSLIKIFLFELSNKEKIKKTITLKEYKK